MEVGKLSFSNSLQCCVCSSRRVLSQYLCNSSGHVESIALELEYGRILLNETITFHEIGGECMRAIRHGGGPPSTGVPGKVSALHCCEFGSREPYRRMDFAALFPPGGGPGRPSKS